MSFYVGDETSGSFDPDNGNTGFALSSLYQDIDRSPFEAPALQNRAACSFLPGIIPRNRPRWRKAQFLTSSRVAPPFPPLPYPWMILTIRSAGEFLTVFPRIEEGAFNLLRTPAGVCDVDRQEHGAHGANRRRRSEFVTTLTELSAMAPAATTGVSRPECGERDCDDVVQEGPEEILPDYSERAGGEPDCQRDRGQVSFHQS